VVVSERAVVVVRIGARGVVWAEHVSDRGLPRPCSTVNSLPAAGIVSSSNGECATLDWPVLDARCSG
jgi:hypothetical protein